MTRQVVLMCPYVTVTRGSIPQTLVLPVAKLKEADQRIADRYQITQRHSSHFEDVHTGL